MNSPAKITLFFLRVIKICNEMIRPLSESTECMSQFLKCDKLKTFIVQSQCQHFWL